MPGTTIAGAGAWPLTVAMFYFRNAQAERCQKTDSNHNPNAAKDRGI